MSFRAWLSLITLGLIAVVIFFSRHSIAHAFHLLEHINIWILLLLIPCQLLMYFAAGETMFSYLKAKKYITNIPPLSLARMSLEMNFVNHILPSGGVSGLSYMGWRMGHYGVSPGRATMAQVVRFSMTFVAFIVLLVIAVVMVTIDGNINRWIILVSAAIVTLLVGVILGGIYLVSSEKRMDKFGTWLVRTVNRTVKKVTFGRRRKVMKRHPVMKFMNDMHRDYVALRADKRVLLKPFLWGIIFTLADMSMFLISFYALGHPVNPAPILIAYGVASIAGFFVLTPGGAGAYEAIMVAFLAVAGLSKGVAIAGILLTRVVILLGTIGLGYIFYQHALIKYGKKRGRSHPTL